MENYFEGSKYNHKASVIKSISRNLNERFSINFLLDSKMM